MKNNINNKFSNYYKNRLLSLLLVTAITVGGCGESEEEKYAKSVLKNSITTNQDIESKINGFMMIICLIIYIT